MNAQASAFLFEKNAIFLNETKLSLDESIFVVLRYQNQVLAHRMPEMPSIVGQARCTCVALLEERNQANRKEVQCYDFTFTLALY